MSESGDLRITSKQYTCFPIQSQRHLHSQTVARRRVAILHPHRHGLFGNGEDELTGKVTVGYSSAPGKSPGKRILFMVVSPGKIENRYLGHYKKQ